MKPRWRLKDHLWICIASIVVDLSPLSMLRKYSNGLCLVMKLLFNDFAKTVLRYRAESLMVYDIL